MYDKAKYERERIIDALQEQLQLLMERFRKTKRVKNLSELTSAILAVLNQLSYYAEQERQSHTDH